MTIKALRSVVAHGNLSLSPGEVADVPDHIARLLISTGKALLFTAPPTPPPAAPIIETAAVQPAAETAALQHAKPRRLARKP